MIARWPAIAVAMLALSGCATRGRARLRQMQSSISTAALAST
jgi:hypothetical protein